MILHIFPQNNTEVFKTYIRFVNENFDISNHLFVTVNEKNNIPDEIMKYTNIQIIDPNDNNKDLILFELVKKSQKVLFHSLLGNPKLMLRILSKRSMFKKIYWIAWGHDLYEWKQVNSSYKAIILNIVRLSFTKNIRYFIGVFPPDIDFFKKEFKTNATTFYAPYVSTLYDYVYKTLHSTDTLEYKIRNNECINIQIGHHSTRTLNHISVLEELARFKNKRIKIFIPLSYGDEEYAKLVADKAKQLFDNKAVIFNKMMKKDDYLKHLSTVDIAIFNTDRQIGLGNITPLLFMGKKVYLPNDTVMYDYYINEGVSVNDYKEMADLNYNAFVSPIDSSGAQKYVQEHHLNRDRKIKQWEAIFQ